MDLVQTREALVEFLRQELIGPGSEHEEMPEAPHPYYIAGVLYPQEADDDGAVEDDPDATGGFDQDNVDDEVYDHKPSAMGMSFVVPRSATGIIVSVDAAYYDESEDQTSDDRTAESRKEHGDEKRRIWTRRPLPRVELEFRNDGNPGQETTPKEDIWSDVGDKGSPPRARIHVRWRRPVSVDEDVVTVTLVNAREFERSDEPDCSIHLFQCKMAISVSGGVRFRDMQGRTSIDWNDEEEDELTLIYRDRKVFATGHGCSVSWECESGDDPLRISTETMPSFELPGVDFKRGEIPADNLAWGVLADDRESTAQLIERLNKVRKGYVDWIKTQQETLEELGYADDHRLGRAGKRLLERMRDASGRIRDGIRYLEEDPAARKAFRLANLAILMQRKQVEPARAGGLHQPGDSSPFDEDLFNPEVARSQQGGWRPFQLAFFLMVLPSLVDPTRDDRDVVDLLWFPTGGGKTEAYLGLAAFEIFRRRLVSPQTGDGTVVLKRYTYRVLTFQQFERAGAVVCACELIRRSRPELGETPITIGMWVGGANTPNRHDDELLKQIEKLSAEDNPFQIRKCPWCGTRLIGEERSEHFVGEHRGRIRFQCRDSRCPFGQPHCNERSCRALPDCLGIPMLLVDDDIYDYPPSMVVATIDKFAQLPWLERVGRLFGARSAGDADRDPPSLFIQDELHLINGSLGTLAAMFESAIDVICERRGARPKIIGATATLRRGGEQCRGLYGRDPVEQVLAFPPAGLSADDSYFMRLDRSSPGRLYLGVMGQGQKSTEILSSILASAALGAVDPSVVGTESPDGIADGYWTSVVYHNSLPELGRTLGLAGREVPQRMEEMAERRLRLGQEAGTRFLTNQGAEPLSGQTQSADIPTIMDRLDRRGGEEDAIDVLCCTSIVGVGVDKQRLGFMVMHGQPGTTAEYIQASSRVGRGETPGIVVANFSANRARDLSHYEGFQSYHASIYRFVEPTSVTPFTNAACGRALAAALVAALRHGLPAPEDRQAGAIDLSSERYQAVRDAFIRRSCLRASELDVSSLVESIDDMLQEWQSLAGPKLRYADHHVNRRVTYLLRPDDTNDRKRGRWPAPNSMRLVDRECDLRPMWRLVPERATDDA